MAAKRIPPAGLAPLARARPRHHTARLPVLASALAGLLAASCGDSPTSPTPPTTLSIACPANVEVVSLDGRPAPVTYDPPKTSGGAAPVSSACAPPSGSAFPVGTTQVMCTATDTASRTAACIFTATVTAAPRISATRHLAFGNSLTEGVVSAPLPTWLVADPSQSYPTKLRALLAARYVAQTIDVVNSGKSGELAIEGVKRLPAVLASLAPETLLLLEGANDLNNQGLGSDVERVRLAAGALEQMVAEAQRRRIRVYLATLPPWRPPRDVSLPVSLNQAIALISRGRGADLVDLYAGMIADRERLIGQDGLHPTEAGYDRMAEIFFNALRATLETSQLQGLLFSVR